MSAYLLDHKTGTCGTVKKVRKHFPSFGFVPKGERELQVSDKLLAVKWYDKREVHMLATEHTREMMDSGKVNHVTNEPIMKPDCVIDYNTNMRLIDKADMQISAIECVRRTVKWYKKLFFHLMDMSMLNAYNMFV